MHFSFRIFFLCLMRLYRTFLSEKEKEAMNSSAKASDSRVRESIRFEKCSMSLRKVMWVGLHWAPILHFVQHLSWPFGSLLHEFFHYLQVRFLSELWGLTREERLGEVEQARFEDVGFSVLDETGDAVFVPEIKGDCVRLWGEDFVPPTFWEIERFSLPDCYLMQDLSLLQQAGILFKSQSFHLSSFPSLFQLCLWPNFVLHFLDFFSLIRLIIWDRLGLKYLRT